jgi:outer membrane murein-binding lipoprotein Lpp
MSERRGVQRAPRSGGRTTEQRSTPEKVTSTPATAGRRSSGSSSDARGARHFPTLGATALTPDPVPPIRATETAPRLRVAPPAPITVPRAPFVALVLTLVVAGVFGILLINTKTNENSFQISELQKQQAVLDNEQQQLQKQIDMYETPGNLHAAARKLGLVIGQPALIRLPDGRVINPLTPGRGELAITAQGAGAGTAASTGR